MLSSDDVKGLMAMMPAFATDDADDLFSTLTIDVGRLYKGLDRMIRDGVNVIATTGSFGECHTLLADEFRILANETVAVVKKRVPVFVGVTSLHTREVVEKCKIVADAGADGILVGVPYYFPSTIENAVRFYKDIGEAFPNLNIMIYHNPVLHNVTLPVAAFEHICKNHAVVGIKDSHRKPDELKRLVDISNGRMSVIVHQAQFAEFSAFGAPGFWSIDAWMGPWPQLALRDSVQAGDLERAHAITADLAPPKGGALPNLSWRETASKIAIRMAGYVDPGPLRPPFVEIPQDVIERQEAKVKNWHRLCDKYKGEHAVTG